MTEPRPRWVTRQCVRLLVENTRLRSRVSRLEAQNDVLSVQLGQARRDALIFAGCARDKNAAMAFVEWEREIGDTQ